MDAFAAAFSFMNMSVLDIPSRICRGTRFAHGQANAGVVEGATLGHIREAGATSMVCRSCAMMPGTCLRVVSIRRMYSVVTCGSATKHKKGTTRGGAISHKQIVQRLRCPSY